MLDRIARRYGKWVSTWPPWLQPAGIMLIYTLPFGIVVTSPVAGRAFGLHLATPTSVLILLLGMQVASLFYGAAKSVLHLQAADNPFILGALASLGFSLTMYAVTCLDRRMILPLTLPGMAAFVGALLVFGLCWKLSVAKPESSSER